MSDQSTEGWEEPSLDAPKRAGRGAKIAVVLLIAAIAAVGVGAIGYASGAGWFAYRTWMYEGGELYVLNMHMTPRWIRVDGLEPVEVPPQNAQLIDLLGGTSHVTVHTSEQGGTPETSYDVTIDHQDAMLKLADKKCLAVVDLRPYYGGGGSKGKLGIVARIRADDHLYIAKTRNIVWPRKDFPPTFHPSYGPAQWMELVGCELLDDDEFLDGYLGFRLEERFRKAQGGP